jgi:phytoene dehydrogenase-like protein
MTQTKVVIVGGGLAGLASAALAAQNGASVTLLDAGKQLGGRGLTRHEAGFAFNLGPHALYDGPAREVLRALGVAFTGAPPQLAGAALLSVQGDLPFPSSLSSLWFNDALSWGERLSLTRVFTRARLPKGKALASSTFEAWLGEQALPLRVERIVRALARLVTYVEAPERLDAASVLAQISLATRGVIYLDGGWQTLVDGLAQAARSHGARLQVQAPVREVRVKDGRVQGVVLKGGEFVHADAVVLAVAPAVAAKLLPGDAEARVQASSCTPVRAACLDLGLSQLPRPDAPFAIDLDSSTYLSVHSLAARLAAPGHALMHVARYLHPSEKVSSEDLRLELEALAERVQPGYRTHLVAEHFSPALTVMEAFPEAERGGRAGRPGVAHTEIAGLYRAGDWVGAEGLLLDASLASAREAARYCTRGARLVAA